jgi:hypothetical protein
MRQFKRFVVSAGGQVLPVTEVEIKIAIFTRLGFIDDMDGATWRNPVGAIEGAGPIWVGFVVGAVVISVGVAIVDGDYLADVPGGGALVDVSQRDVHLTGAGDDDGFFGIYGVSFPLADGTGNGDKLSCHEKQEHKKYAQF